MARTYDRYVEDLHKLASSCRSHQRSPTEVYVETAGYVTVCMHDLARYMYAVYCLTLPLTVPLSQTPCSHTSIDQQWQQYFVTTIELGYMCAGITTRITNYNSGIPLERVPGTVKASLCYTTEAQMVLVQQESTLLWTITTW